MSKEEWLVFLGPMGARWHRCRFGIGSLVQLPVSFSSIFILLPYPCQINLL
jgi:hypothetical protein